MPNRVSKDDLRLLFNDHAIYTKFVITDILQDLPNTESDLGRLLANQHDIGNYVGKFIGKTKGKQLTVLLTDHIKLAGACLGALKADVDLKEPIAKLFGNADQVGEFLHQLNPMVLKQREITDMFRQHNQYVLDMAVAQKEGKYEDVVNLFDKYLSHMISFSDTLCVALSWI